MPATLQSLRGKIATATVCLDPDKSESERTEDDLLTVTYRAHNISADVEKLANELAKDDRQIGAVVELSLPVFVSWDLKMGPTEQQVDQMAEIQARLDAAGSKSERESIAHERDELRFAMKATVDAQAPIPITREGLSEVPASVLMLILGQLREQRNPNTNGTGA